MFFYSYKFYNDTVNNGSIQEFELNISRPTNSVSLDTVGLRFAGSGLMERWFRRDFPPRQQAVIPIGFPTVPNKKWTVMLANSPTVSFFANSLFVEPGGSLEGITIMSKGLPAIRSFVVGPNFQDDLLFPSIEDTSENAMSTAQMDSIRNAVKFHGWTIGPTAPPLNFDASIWIDTLLSYTRRSVDLGWLGSGRDDDCDNDEHPQDGIERNIEHRLTMAQRELQDGDSVKARRDLQMLVNKVDRIWKRGQMLEKKHEHDREDWWQHRKDWVVMTSEAYALLKYNIDYLIDKPPERERHGGKEKVKRSRTE
jgi:hypothetical protein